MKRNRKHVIILSIGALCAFISYAMAQQGPARLHQERFAPVARTLRAVIKPTPEQQEQMRAVRQNYRPQLRTAKQKLHQAQQALRDALLNPDTTQAALQKQIEAVTAAQADVIRLRANMQFEIDQLLTPEQRTKLKAFRDKMVSLHQEFRQRRHALIKEFVEPASN